jgi:hypothetical protein
VSRRRVVFVVAFAVAVSVATTLILRLAAASLRAGFERLSLTLSWRRRGRRSARIRA